MGVGNVDHDRSASFAKANCASIGANMDLTTILIIVLLVMLLGGGWYGRGRWYGR
jgi:hypothetical protein